MVAGQHVTDRGIDDAIALLERLRADRGRGTSGDGQDIGGDE
jgi:hypothetical protein